MTTNAERLKKYKHKMEDAGFRRLSVYICPDLVSFLARERKPYECGGRILERLLLGNAAKRPEYWTQAEHADRLRTKAKS